MGNRLHNDALGNEGIKDQEARGFVPLAGGTLVLVPSQEAEI